MSMFLFGTCFIYLLSMLRYIPIKQYTWRSTAPQVPCHYIYKSISKDYFHWFLSVMRYIAFASCGFHGAYVHAPTMYIYSLSVFIAKCFQLLLL
jgi:hypothetical protein